MLRNTSVVFNQLGADTAQLNGGDPQIGGDVVLGDPVLEARVLFPEDKIISGGVIEDYLDVVPFFFYPFQLKNP